MFCSGLIAVLQLQYQQGRVITILDLIFHSRAFQRPPRLTVRAYSVVATPTPRSQISAEYIRQAPTFKHPTYKRLLLANRRRQQEVRGNLPLGREILFCKRCLLSTDALSPILVSQKKNVLKKSFVIGTESEVQSSEQMHTDSKTNVTGVITLLYVFRKA